MCCSNRYQWATNWSDAKEQVLRYSESDIQDLDSDSHVTTQALFKSLFKKFNVSFNQQISFI